MVCSISCFHYGHTIIFKIFLVRQSFAKFLIGRFPGAFIHHRREVLILKNLFLDWSSRSTSVRRAEGAEVAGEESTKDELPDKPSEQKKRPTSLLRH